MTDKQRIEHHLTYKPIRVGYARPDASVAQNIRSGFRDAVALHETIAAIECSAEGSAPQ